MARRASAIPPVPEPTGHGLGRALRPDRGPVRLTLPW